MTEPLQFLGVKKFEELFRSEFKGLTVFAMGYVKDVEVARDIVHDTFLGMWEKRQSIDPSKHLKSYLTVAVKNKCLNYLRDNKKFNKDIINLEEHITLTYEPPDKVVETETMNRIDDAINSLPERCGEIFRLNRFGNKKYREIAAELGISIKTVEAQMSKALEHLRQKLKKEYS